MGTPTGHYRTRSLNRPSIVAPLIAPQTTLDLGPVAGEMEGPFRLNFLVKNGSGGSPQVDLRPNGAAPANMAIRRAYNGTFDVQAYLDLCTGLGAGQYGRGNFIIGGVSGRVRTYSGQMCYGTLGSAPAVVVNIEGHWNDTVSLISGFIMTGSLANTFGVGSWAILECLGYGG